MLFVFITKLSLYKKLSTSHKIYLDLNNCRSCIIFGVVHFSEIYIAISYQILGHVFF